MDLIFLLSVGKGAFSVSWTVVCQGDAKICTKFYNQINHDYFSFLNENYGIIIH